jgi:hypothetical protein
MYIREVVELLKEIVKEDPPKVSYKHVQNKTHAYKSLANWLPHVWNLLKYPLSDQDFEFVLN